MGTETVINRPAPFLEAAGEVLTKKLTEQLGTPIDTASYAPTVAAQDALQTQAYNQASGLGSFQPFLNQAGTDATAAQNLTGPVLTKILCRLINKKL